MDSVDDRDEIHCCGCGACKQICPKKCIKMEENERGFLVPVVDKSKCISCGLCKKICPEIKENFEFNEVNAAYAIVSKNNNIQKQSTSGGVFYIIAKYILENNGIVFGAAWQDKYNVSHIAVNNIKELIKLQQSKYIQSNTQNTFEEAKKYLKEKRIVLYSGTACQIQGLKSYLQKEYENLITIEVACHGVPSPGLFRKYIQWLEKKYRNIVVGYQFRNRDKHPGGEHFKSKVVFDNGKVKYFSIYKDPFYNAFLNGVSLRKTCYNCKYKNIKRVADFTLSDFWGIEKELKSFPAYYGCSAVLVNTRKAEEILEKIKCNIIYEKCDKDIIYKHNKSMIESCKRNKEEKFKSIDMDLEQLFKDIISKQTKKEKVKSLIKLMIPYKFLYKLRRMWRR